MHKVLVEGVAILLLGEDVEVDVWRVFPTKLTDNHGGADGTPLLEVA